MTDFKKIRLLLIVGTGGTRIDYIAGWLNTLPDFIESRWTIDPTTGLSRGDFQILKFSDYSSSVQEVLAQSNLELDPGASITWAAGIHGNNLNMTIDQVNAGAISLAVIDVGTKNHDQIRWEMLAKTYLSQRTGVGVMQGWHRSWQIDENLNADLTNEQRIEHFRSIVNSQRNSQVKSFSIEKIKCPAATIEYEKLFVTGGSRYLCQQLNIDTASNRHHQLWDALLPLGTSPDEITAWGYTWTKKNCVG